MHEAFNRLTDAQKKIALERLREKARQARLVAESAVGDLTLVEDELRRRRWASDPEKWCEEKLHDSVWSGQRRILNSVRDHRRTAAKTCHEVGKSFIAGRIAAWWIDSHAPGDAFVVTTAPTAPQVKAILWKEIGRAHTAGRLPGRVNQTEWHIEREGKEELVAFGRKPSDYSPAAFQGIHAPFVLVIVDEANGVTGLWEAIDSVIANDNSKILAIGNPDVPTGEFYEACKPGSGWNVVQISAFDSPNFTGEALPTHVCDQLIGHTYVEEKRRKWAPGWKWNAQHTKVLPPQGQKAEHANPFWLSKVCGEFPTTQGEASLIPLTWIRRAQERWVRLEQDNHLEPSMYAKKVLGGDVGGGGDASTVALKHGDMVKIIHEDHNPDTMETCGTFIALVHTTGAELMRVDSIGIGRGIVDRARELEEPLIAVNVGEAPLVDEDKKWYINLRAELYWHVRELFEREEIYIDPADEDLAAELASLQFKRTSKGQIQIESKDDAKKRGVPSPNRAEALMLACADRVGGITNTKDFYPLQGTATGGAVQFKIPAPIVPGNFGDMARLFGR